MTTPTLELGTDYKQVHTNGSKAGFSFTSQVGRPQISGVTVQPFTYTGCKVTDWEFSCNDNQIAQLKVTMDGRNESTAIALAAASYPTPNGLFSFADATNFKIGGTATTSAGETTVASGVAVAPAGKPLLLTRPTPTKGYRRRLGNPGLKNEPVANPTPTIHGPLATQLFS